MPKPGIVLHDYLIGPWETVRGDLVEELEKIQLFIRRLAISVVDDAYPIGTVYLTTSLANPADLLGSGTWQALTPISGINAWERIA